MIFSLIVAFKSIINMKFSETNPNLYKKNRTKLIEKLPNRSLSIVFSNDKMPRNGDLFFPYRQNSDLFYLTGINQEETVLFIYKRDEKECDELLIISKKDKNRETWEGRKLCKEEASEISGIEKVMYETSIIDLVHEIREEFDLIFINRNENPRFISPIKQKFDRFYDLLVRHYEPDIINSLSPFINYLRMKKEPEEISLIKKACNITALAFEKAVKKISQGVGEYEVEAEIISEFYRNKAVPAFDTIVASGLNACYLHYIENNCVIGKEQLVLMDFGAEYSNYASDCSRTVPAGGKFSKRQKELYESCLIIYTEARKFMKPGISINTYHGEVCRLWEQEHIKLGLYTKEELNKQNPEKTSFF